MHGEARHETRAFVGARIREIRKRHGMGVRTLSELSDVPELTIGMMEGGRMLVRFENLLCIARGLGVPVTELFTDPDDREAEDVDE